MSTAEFERREFISKLFALAALGVCHSALAALPETVARIRSSLVAVGTFQRTRNPSFRPAGTGFAVADGSFIVTNSHVISEVLDTAQLEQRAVAVLERGQISVREVKLVASDPAHDLALLRLTGGAPLPPLTLAPSTVLREGQAIALSGFPLGNILGLFPVTHHGIVSALAPIGIPAEQARQLNPRLARQLADGVFDIIQLDVTAFPGNSGSPLFDPDSGEVLGIINSVLVRSSRENGLSAPTGITYAVPVRYLADLLKTVS